ncbi:unnamed protein product [Miscanthus lutarioriparius]|uniref:Large ribosomal subunit protein uL18 C-terminal eukaryotes domain-containing protein n=1 Tax=Miscanthus lutarioriparius TaxID=422564 RepID=A0A811MZ11_9POAL|nr:unnamed protein product [Miscanthus lutarioriparius]
MAEGALDGGLDIPHSEKRFAGFKKDDKQLDADIHRKYIYGAHVTDYMKNLAEEEPEKYQPHFSEFIQKGIEAEDMEALYKKVHAAIGADPSMVKSTKQPPKEHNRYNPRKLTYEQRKASLVERLNQLNSSTIKPKNLLTCLPLNYIKERYVTSVRFLVAWKFLITSVSLQCFVCP